MKTLIKTIFLTLLTFNVIGQTKTKIYNFSYDEKINDFHNYFHIYSIYFKTKKASRARSFEIETEMKFLPYPRGRFCQ